MILLEELRKKIVPFQKGNGKNYDIVLLNDGSKNALLTFFLINNIFNLKPLVITFNHNKLNNFQKSNIKKSNEYFDTDHLIFTPRLSVQEKMDREFPQNSEKIRKHGEDVFLIRIAWKYRISLICRPTNLLDISNIIDISLQDVFEKDKFLADLNYKSKGFTEFDFCSYKFPGLNQIKKNISELIIGLDLLKNQEVEDTIFSEFTFEDNTIEDSKYFWVGFPDDWKKVIDENKNKERKPTRYESLAKLQPYGEPLFKDKVEYCIRCCMPVTAEGLELDELGICQPCRSSEQKMHINWVERKAKLEEILNLYTNDNYYDCMVPISGGKDSTYQLYVLSKVFNRKVIACTFSHNWYSETGRYNLMNAIRKFDVDHIMMVPRRRAIHKFAKKSLGMIGDSCWHCHAGVGAFPLQIAVKFGVKLLIWGESVSENDGRATYEKPIVFDRDYFTKISARYYAEEMMDDSIDYYDIQPYILPTHKEVENENVVGIHLGDYIFWDDERQMEFVRDNFEWKEDKVEGAYKGYKSVECVMAGIHDYTKFIKRGFGRATDHASQDVRNGLLTREDGFELAKKTDSERPPTLDYYLKITGLNEEEFEQILLSKRDNNAKDIP